jgi:hypothetical protein
MDFGAAVVEALDLGGEDDGVAVVEEAVEVGVVVELRDGGVVRPQTEIVGHGGEDVVLAHVGGHVGVC